MIPISFPKDRHGYFKNNKILTYFPHSVHKECPGENAFSFSAVVRVESFFFPLLRILPVICMESPLMLPVNTGNEFIGEGQQA